MTAKYDRENEEEFGEPDEEVEEVTITSTEEHHEEGTFLLDLTPQFNRIFSLRSFSSFKEFEVLFKRFKEETGSVFRIKSSSSVEYENSRRKKHFIPAKFKFVTIKYCCVHYGQPKISGQGIRTKQRYLPCGCNCVLSVVYNRGALCISQVNMLHNHEVSSAMAPYYAINRRINYSELRQVSEAIELMPNSRALQNFLQEHFHRPITLQDAKNVRARLKVYQLQEKSSSCNDTSKHAVCQEKKNEETTVQNEQVDHNVDEANIFQEDIQLEQQNHQFTCQVKVLDELNARLANALDYCDSNIFWERVSLINQMITQWENEDNLDTQKTSDNQKDKSFTIFEKEPEVRQLEISSVQHREGTVPYRSKHFHVANSCISDPSENSTHAKITGLCNLSEQCYKDRNIYSVSKKLRPANAKQRRMQISGSHEKREKALNEVGQYQNEHIVVELSKGSEVRKHRNGRNKLKTLKQQCNVRHESNAEQNVWSDASAVSKISDPSLCNQAMTVEIEVDGEYVRVKTDTKEPIEYSEVDITDSRLCHLDDEHSYV